MSTKLPESEFGNGLAALDEMRNVVRPEERGFFIGYKQAIVRYALAVPYGGDAGVREIPSGEEILGELDKLP